jgi:type II secretory pathway component GspD/PulD (secretin)
MSPPSRRCRAFATLIVALLPALAFAAPTPTGAASQEASPAEKIKKQLDQPITLEISDQSVNAALNQIREQTKINFVVDRFTIQQLGLDPEQMPVSVKLKDAKARSCLRAVLSPYNLGYAIIGDTVLVSTDDMAMYRQMKQRVSIDVEKMDLAAALKKLSKETATNLLLDSRVPAKDAKTEVTLQMEDVPLETAVRLMAETAGLKPVKVGNVFLLTTKAIANEMRNDPDLNPPNNNPNVNMRTDMLQQWQWQQMAPNNIIFGNVPGQAIGNININGIPQQPGNVPIPPLEKPADKNDQPADDDKPAQPEKKPDPVKQLPK